jgi:serine/threonine protein phosphatase PrpC
VSPPHRGGALHSPRRWPRLGAPQVAHSVASPTAAAPVLPRMAAAAVAGEPPASVSPKTATPIAVSAGERPSTAAPPPASRPTSYGARCATGRRSSNEDAHIVVECVWPTSAQPPHVNNGCASDGSSSSTTATATAPPTPTSLLSVFDGHGGPLCAQLAGQGFLRHLHQTELFADVAALEVCLATDFVEEGQLSAKQRVTSALHTAFLSLDRDILEQQRRQQDDPAAGSSAMGDDESGCTGVVVLTTPTCYVCANVGDSRACVLTPRGPARALSTDHKPDNAAEKARIEAAGGTVVSGRINGSLAVARAFGDPPYKDQAHLPVEQQRVVAVPDIVVLPRRLMEDEVLLVACDGVWDVLTTEQCNTMLMEGLAHLQRSQIQPTQWAQLLCDDLIDICYARGSGDNMTALIAIHGAHSVATPASATTFDASEIPEADPSRCSESQQRAIGDGVSADDLRLKWRARWMLGLDPVSARRRKDGSVPAPVFTPTAALGDLGDLAGGADQTVSTLSLAEVVHRLLSIDPKGDRPDCADAVAGLKLWLRKARSIDDMAGLKSCPWKGTQMWAGLESMPARIWATSTMTQWFGPRTSGGQPWEQRCTFLERLLKHYKTSNVNCYEDCACACAPPHSGLDVTSMLCLACSATCYLSAIDTVVGWLLLSQGKLMHLKLLTAGFDQVRPSPVTQSLKPPRRWMCCGRPAAD